MTALRGPAICSAVALLLGALPARADVHALIVGGLGGEPAYESKFLEQATVIASAVGTTAEAAGNVVTLTGKSARREALERELAELAARAAPADAVVVVFLGHGSFDGEEYRFNLPGPDITGRELASLLGKLKAGQQLIVNATSSSGAVVEDWTRDGRVLITATRSGGERNATRFAEFWVEALSSAEADRDKNQVVTAAEAFEFASRKVTDAYKADAALATEHARLEGDNAARFTVARLGGARSRFTDTTLAALETEQATIERQLDALRAQKASLDAEVYYDELETTLVALALVDRSIDRRRAALEAGAGSGQDTTDVP